MRGLSLAQAQTLPRGICFAREPFAKIPALPFDKAVMEKTQKGAVLELDTAWSDVGDWNSLWQIKAKDADHNACFGTTMTQATKKTLVYGDSDTLIATIGIEDTVVIQHDHAVLVAKRNASEDINSLISQIEKDHPEALISQTDYRPWGHYQILKRGQGFLVKQITVDPQGILSLQYHHHRSEHWTIVQGCARITCDSKVLTLQHNQSIFIPLKAQHRLENIGTIPLILIEVQIGTLLKEDDIVRLEDAYGRQTNR